MTACLLTVVATAHLEQRDVAFELIPHRQADTSTEEARALGVDAGLRAARGPPS